MSRHAIGAKTLVAAIVTALALVASVPAIAGAPGRTVLALIVTNNRGAGLDRPDLHYADDDGAKYYEVFRTIATEDATFLLTDFDRDTAKLFPHLLSKAQTPDRAHIDAAALQIAKRAREAVALGGSVDFYFVFAGHGDVDEGQGFLELTDSHFTGDDLEALLKSIPSTRSHVILDSCNSFFVLGARKPGGQHFATSADAARTLSERLPNVGVFLSTSADGQVFEWSELQSGIFSHAVRSGLAGGADANGDGVVSYQELAAFVNVAAAEVRNPAYRPQVFARAPGGRNGEALFAMARHDAVRLDLERERKLRLTVRDADDLPWVDVHKEAGAAMSLYLPRRWGAHAVVEEREVTSGGSRVVARRALDLGDEAASATLSALALVDRPHDPRGGADMFHMLFARPFGPRAYAQYEAAEREQSPQVFGISQDDRERMRVLLAEVAEEERDRRIEQAAGFFGSALAVGTLGAYEGFRDGSDVGRYLGAASLGVAVGLAVVGVSSLVTTSPGEDIYARYTWGLRQSPDEFAKLVSSTEESLFLLAHRYRRRRLVERWLGLLELALAIPVLAYDAGSSPPAQTLTITLAMWTVYAVLGGGFVISSFVPYPIERLAEIWKSDPARQRFPRISLAPVSGGAVLGLGGSF